MEGIRFDSIDMLVCSSLLYTQVDLVEQSKVIDVVLFQSKHLDMSSPKPYLYVLESQSFDYQVTCNAKTAVFLKLKHIVRASSPLDLVNALPSPHINPTCSIKSGKDLDHVAIISKEWQSRRTHPK